MSSAPTPQKWNRCAKRKPRTLTCNVLQVIDPYYFKDVDGLLANYDEALMHVPKTYEEHFKLAHYAFSAVVLFNQHKVAPIFLREKGFKSIFDRRLAQLQADFVKSRRSGAQVTSTQGLVTNNLPASESPHRMPAPALFVLAQVFCLAEKSGTHVNDHE